MSSLSSLYPSQIHCAIKRKFPSFYFPHIPIDAFFFMEETQLLLSSQSSTMVCYSKTGKRKTNMAWDASLTSSDITETATAKD